MRRHEISPVARLIFGSAVYVVVVVVAAAMLWEWTLVDATVVVVLTGSVAAAAVFIWGVVHATNRRDDSRPGNRPSDSRSVHPDRGVSH
jgi:hypothetical protein